MPKKSKTPDTNPDVLFYRYLWNFYQRNRQTIRRSYLNLTKSFLDFNDPDGKENTFLRRPQFEALEIYVFLKEGLDNAAVWKIFDAWLKKEGAFEGRPDAFAGGDEQGELFGNIDADAYDQVFKAMRSGAQDYVNYIFALTMGVGKTILMASAIAYEFLLSRKYPKDPRYCHNALVFAPDTTVLQALREIVEFDYGLVVPPEYADLFRTNINFFFLEDTSMTLNVQDGSDFNVVISNAQKIIIRSSHTEKGAAEQLFAPNLGDGESGASRLQALLGGQGITSENDLEPNQRFQKLLRLRQLGIFVDEAHHAFGKNLARDVGAEKDTRKTSLRKTISALAAAIKAKGSRVVACYNFTGTPYAAGRIFPEVVYAYGLREAINNEYLKRARLVAYENVKSPRFVEETLRDFFESYGGKRYENRLPKIAFFAATIDELETELRPEVERVMGTLDLPVSSLLVNHQGASSDDIREFNRLDTPTSTKQVILLVNKGKEGWNCRSLFGVALYRKPKSKIFVLQASMRCLREIDFPPQHAGSIYLTTENQAILDAELQANFRLSVDQFEAARSKRQRYEVRPLPPPRRVRIRRTRTMFDVRRKNNDTAIDFSLDEINPELYRERRIVREGLDPHGGEVSEDLAPYSTDRSDYTLLSLVAECARYLGYSGGDGGEVIGMKPTEIEQVLRDSKDGVEAILKAVNTWPEVIYDQIIPRLFGYRYSIEHYTKPVDEEINLVEEPEGGMWVLSGDPELTRLHGSVDDALHTSTFHLDHYIFDSKPEWRFYDEMMILLRAKKIRQIYFTGMLTHGQSRFNIPYVDPDTGRLRTYYPDFLIELIDKDWLIVEVKGAHQLDDRTVLAKAEYARQMFSSGTARDGVTFRYIVISDRDVMDSKSAVKVMEGVSSRGSVVQGTDQQSLIGMH